MGDLVINHSLGRTAEIFDDGADCILVVLSAMEADANVKDGNPDNTLGGGSGLIDAAGNTEAVGSSWSVRKTIANASVTVTVDDAGDLVKVLLPDQTYTAVASANDVTDMWVCEDGATDTLRNVLTSHDFIVVTDGNDVTADFHVTNGFWQSS